MCVVLPAHTTQDKKLCHRSKSVSLPDAVQAGLHDDKHER